MVGREVVGADADRVGLTQVGELGPDGGADDGQQVAAVEPAADDPATVELGGVLPRPDGLDGDATVELEVHAPKRRATVCQA